MPCECCGRAYGVRDQLRMWWEQLSPKHRRLRAAEEEAARQRYAERREYEQRLDHHRQAMRFPTDPSRALRQRICTCRSFSDCRVDSYFVTPHGHCGYCGGWQPEVYRQHCGDAALQSKIDELALHDRERIRASLALTPPYFVASE